MSSSSSTSSADETIAALITKLPKRVNSYIMVALKDVAWKNAAPATLNELRIALLDRFMNISVKQQTKTVDDIVHEWPGRTVGFSKLVHELFGTAFPELSAGESKANARARAVWLSQMLIQHYDPPLSYDEPGSTQKGIFESLVERVSVLERKMDQPEDMVANAITSLSLKTN